MSAPGPVRTAPITKDEWQTPRYVFDYWDQIYRFNLDAAASKDNAMGGWFYDQERDSLANAWSQGVTAWLNPPYGAQATGQWVERCIVECTERSSTIVALLPNNTDTRWFARAYQTASRISFLEGRISFIDPVMKTPVSGNPCGSIFIAWHPTPYRSAPQVEHIRIPKVKK